MALAKIGYKHVCVCVCDKCYNGVNGDAEAPFLSSWTLYLQAVLIFGGWHPWCPGQVGENLDADAGGNPEEKRQEEQVLGEQAQPAAMRRNDDRRRKRLMV